MRFHDCITREDGSIKRVQGARGVAPFCEQYHSKRAVIPLAEEFLLPLNSGKLTPESTMTLGQFVEKNYLLHVVSQMRASTHNGYKAIWESCLKVRCGDICLREFRTCEGESPYRSAPVEN